MADRDQLVNFLARQYSSSRLFPFTAQTAIRIVRRPTRGLHRGSRQQKQARPKRRACVSTPMPDVRRELKAMYQINYLICSHF